MKVLFILLLAFSSQESLHKQKPWIIEQDISNEEKRDGNHIALGRNTFINCGKKVDDDKRVSRIFVKSEIK